MPSLPCRLVAHAVGQMSRIASPCVPSCFIVFFFFFFFFLAHPPSPLSTSSFPFPLYSMLYHTSAPVVKCLTIEFAALVAIDPSTWRPGSGFRPMEWGIDMGSAPAKVFLCMHIREYTDT